MTVRLPNFADVIRDAWSIDIRPLHTPYKFWDRFNAFEEAERLAENRFTSGASVPLVFGAVAVSLGVALWHDCIPL